MRPIFFFCSFIYLICIDSNESEIIEKCENRVENISENIIKARLKMNIDKPLISYQSKNVIQDVRMQLGWQIKRAFIIFSECN